eukprot:11939081-Prorocentrum_lima.AAC.1
MPAGGRGPGDTAAQHPGVHREGLHLAPRPEYVLAANHLAQQLQSAASPWLPWGSSHGWTA